MGEYLSLTSPSQRCDCYSGSVSAHPWGILSAHCPILNPKHQQADNLFAETQRKFLHVTHDPSLHQMQQRLDPLLTILLLGRHSCWTQLQHLSSRAVCWCTVHAALSPRKTVIRCQPFCPDTKTMPTKLPLGTFCLIVSLLPVGSCRHCRTCMTWTGPLLHGLGEQLNRQKCKSPHCWVLLRDPALYPGTAQCSCPGTATRKQCRDRLSFFLCLLMFWI